MAKPEEQHSWTGVSLKLINEQKGFKIYAYDFSRKFIFLVGVQVQNPEYSK